MGDERLTYAELESASNRLARQLLEAGCSRSDRVCLLAPKSPTTMVAMLATLKAGGAYVPIDTASPAARIARIFRAAEPAAVLTLGSAASIADELRAENALDRAVPVGALDELATSASAGAVAFGPADVGQQESQPLPQYGSEEDTAHLLFTSGSTGDPKGVVIKHANVRAFVEWGVSYFGIQPGDRLSGHPPLHFDLSGFDFYGAMRAGAELHLVPPETLLPQQLARFIQTAELTQWFAVPSAMTYMTRFGAVPDEGFPTLQRVLWCGEVLPTSVLVDWMRRIPQASFTNLYGPTEATIASSYYTVPGVPTHESEAIPIGTPCDGEELLIVDDEGRPAKDGEIGELCIGGAGLSPGYWRDEAKTRAVFVSDPRPGRESERIYRTGDLARVGEDGLYYFLGRADSQIKSRGYRIELGEIETAVNARPEIGECAVVATASDGFEGVAICCAYAPSNGAVDSTALRTALTSVLPAYMLPSRWLSMEKLPENSNGKIDRRRLREMFSSEIR